MLHCIRFMKNEIARYNMRNLRKIRERQYWLEDVWTLPLDRSWLNFEECPQRASSSFKLLEHGPLGTTNL